jgi:hypothetical protein
MLNARTHTQTQTSPKNLTEMFKEEKKLKRDAMKPRKA